MSFIFNPNNFSTSNATEEDMVVLRRNINTLQSEIDTVESDIISNYFNKNNDTTLNNAIVINKDFTLSSNASYDFPINYPTNNYKTVLDNEVTVAGDISSNDLRTMISTSTSKEIWIQPKLYVFSFLSMSRTTPIIIRKNPSLEGEVIFRGPDSETFVNFNSDNGTIFKDITFESGFLGSPNIDSIINYKGDGLVLDSCKFYSQEFAVVFSNTSSNYTIRNCEFFYTKASSMVASLPSNSTHRYIGVFSLNGKCFISGNEFYGFDGHNGHGLFFSGQSAQYNGELVINNNFTDEKMFRFCTHETFGTSPRLRLEIRENIFNVKNSCFIWVAPDHRFFSSILIKGNTMNMIGGGSKGLIGYFLTVNSGSIDFLPSYETPLIAFVSSNTLNFNSYHPSFIPIGDGLFARGNSWTNLIPVIDDTRQLKNLGIIGEVFDSLQVEDNRLSNNLQTEINDRTNAINTVNSSRIDGDLNLQNNINAEITNRINSDTTLQNNINAEITNRTNADITLQNNINTKQDIITITAEKILKSDANGRVADSGISNIVLTNVVNNVRFNTTENTAPSVMNFGNANISEFNIGTNNSVQKINIGTGNGVTTINLGGVGDTININGLLTTINTTNKEITDKLITLNKNGGINSGHDTGFEIEEDGAITGFVKTDGTGSSFQLKAPNNPFILGTGVLTQNETIAYLTQIGELDNKINTNINQINSNITQIESLQAEITASDIQINNNFNKITTNSNNILSNSGTIQANSNAILANTNAIQVNTNAIQVNTNAIQANSNAIQANTNSIDNITTLSNSNSISINQNNFAIQENRTILDTLTTSVAANTDRLPLKQIFTTVDLTTSISSFPIPSLGELRNYKIIISGLLPPSNGADATLCMRINQFTSNYQGAMDIDGATRDAFFSDRFPLLRTVFASGCFIHCVLNVTHNFDFNYPSFSQRILMSSEGTVIRSDNQFLFRFNSFGSLATNNIGESGQNINSFEFFLNGRDFTVGCNLAIEIVSI